MQNICDYRDYCDSTVRLPNDEKFFAQSMFVKEGFLHLELHLHQILPHLQKSRIN